MYRIEITKDYLGFASAHFITFKGKCERLHGHNYQVWVEVEGALTDDGYVFDFIELKRLARTLCDRLDHRVLLATENPRIAIEHDGASIHARYETRHYQFPADDVVLLPLSNTTAELLAAYLAGQLAQCLRDRRDHQLTAVGVWVAEGPGQRAFYRAPLS